MTLTKSFTELVQCRVAADRVWRGPPGRGNRHLTYWRYRYRQAIFRDYIKVTVGFEKLGEATATQPKSLIRMFGPRGNPQARNLFSVIGSLQKH